MGYFRHQKSFEIQVYGSGLIARFKKELIKPKEGVFALSLEIQNEEGQWDRSVILSLYTPHHSIETDPDLFVISLRDSRIDYVKALTEKGFLKHTGISIALPGTNKEAPVMKLIEPV